MERTAGTEGGQARVRTGLADSTEQLSQALRRNVDVIAAENSVLRENVALLERAAVARRTISATAISGVPLVRTTGGAVSAAPGALAAAEDPLARQRYTEALAAQAAAQARYAESRGAYSASMRPTSGAGAAEQAALLGQQEEARQQLAAAKRVTVAEQSSVAQQEQLATARKAEQQELARTNAALAQKAAADEAAARASAEIAAEQRGQVSRMTFSGAALAASAGPVRMTSQMEGYLATSTGLSSGGNAMATMRAAGYSQAPRMLWNPVTSGGPADATHYGQLSGDEATALGSQRMAATRNAQAISGLGAAQRDANLAFNESVAAYAASSNALSRHGALTTEFISAFSRGQVTLREFGEQMTSTMGKFGGWVVAGAAVYGVYESLRHLGAGATETQAGVEQVGRFIPSVSQPGGQTALAQELRDISVQFNVPIKDVVDSMSVVARAFHNVADAGNATRAVLAAVKLDLVPREQAVQYVMGISQTMGWNQLPAGEGGEKALGLINALNETQRQFSARVQETLPAVARAAPAALASGTDIRTIEALASVGVTAGIPGNQIGTALLRSMGTFAFRPTSEATFARYGIEADPANYGKLVNDVISVVDRQGADRISQPEVRLLAQALGGPLLGSKSWLPILEREYRTPGTISQYEQAVRQPGSFQSDLDRVLNTVSERFKSLGVTLEQFGSELESSGVLQPVIGLFDVVGTVAHALEAMTTPLVHAVGVFNELPGAVREALGVFLAFRALRAFSASNLGLTTTGIVGRLPGLGEFAGDDRQLVRETRARLQNYQLPLAEQVEGGADRRVTELRARLVAQQNEMAAYATAHPEGRTAQEGTPEYQSYNTAVAQMRADQTATERRITTAAREAQIAGETTARTQAQIAVLKDRHYTVAERAAYIEDRGLVAATQGVSLQEQANRAERAVIEGVEATAVAAREQAAAMGMGAGSAGAGAALAGAGAMAVAARRSAEGGAASEGELVRLAAFGGLTRGGAEGGALVGARSGAPELVGQRWFAAPIDRLNAAGEKLDSFAARLRDGARSAMTGPGGAMAGLMATQLIGSVAGGGAGNYISSVGGSAFTGLMIAQMMGAGRSGSFAGLGLGLLAGGLQQGRNTSGLVTDAAGGATLGLGIGLMAGGGPLTGAVGALVGGGLGLGAGLLGLGGPSGPKNLPTGLTGNDIITQVSRGGQANAQDVQTFGDTFSDTLNKAFTSTGDSATNAQNSITKQMTQLTSLVSAFGATSTVGRSAIRLLSAAMASAAENVATDPQGAGQILAKFGTIVQQAQQDAMTAIKWGAAAAQAARVPDNVRAALGSAAITQGPTAVYGPSPLAIGGGPGIGQITPAISAPGLTTRFQWARNAQFSSLSSTPGAGSYYSMAIRQMDDAMREGMQATYDKRTQLQQTLDVEDRTLSELERGGGQTKTWTTVVGGGTAHAHTVTHTQSVVQQVAALKAARQDTMNRLDGVNQAITNAEEQMREANDAAWQQIIQAESSARTQDAQIANTASRAHPVLQANRTLSAASANVASTRARIREAGSQVSPAERRALIETALQQQYDAQGQLAQAVTQQAQGAGALRAAAQPSYDTVGRARIEAQTAAEVYRQLAAMPSMKGSPELQAALTNLMTAQTALKDAIHQQAENLISSEEQLAVAQAQGDAGLEAAAHARAAAQQLAVAQTPAERATAQAGVISAHTQAADAARENADMRGQIAQAAAYGNDVAGAEAAVALAQADMASAHNTQQRLQAELALQNAENQLQQAREARIMEMAQLRASETNDPVKQSRILMQGSLQALNATPRSEVDLRAQRQTDYNNRRQQYEASLIQTREDTINFQLTMQQITTQQAINQLQDLLHMKGLTTQARHQILEQIRQLQQGDNTGGQFDLAPGSIHLPTFADVTRAIYHATGGRASRDQTSIGDAAHVSRTTADAVGRAHTEVHRAVSALANPTVAREIRIDNRPVIQVYVGDRRDLPAVADALDRGLHSSLKSRLRAAGIRGT